MIVIQVRTRAESFTKGEIMKARLMLIVILAAIALAVSAAPAAAESEGCSSVSFTLQPDSGPPGTIVTLSGGGAYDTVYIDIFWDETDMATLLTDVYGDFYYLFAVPGDATPGAHTVYFDGPDNEDDDVICPRTFTVTGSGDQGATTGQPPVTGTDTPSSQTSGSQSSTGSTTTTTSSLPSTGFPLMPAAALALGGLGLAATITRRR